MEILDQFFSFLESQSSAKNLLASVLILLGLVATKFLIRKNIEKNSTLKKAEKAMLIKRSRTYLNAFFFVVIFLLWFTHLQAFFVSLIAVAAALVLATKELIMCVTGGMLIKLNNYFQVGDQIEVAGSRGYVLDKTFTSTKILEIGPEKASQQTTGNILNIPNSLLLNNVVKNESYFKGFSIKAFTFPVREGELVEQLEKRILEWSSDYCADYIDQARLSISRFCDREGVIIPSIEPRTKLVIDDEGRVSILVKLPIKNTSVADAEQFLLRRYVKIHPAAKK